MPRRILFPSLILALSAVATPPILEGQEPVPAGGELQVNTYTTSGQFSPSVAAAANGDFVVVWTSHGSYGSDTSSRSVQGQRYASDGTPRGGEFQVNTYTTDWQGSPAVVADGEGDFVVVWTSHGSSGDTSDSSVQARRYAADGTALSGEFQVNTYTPGRKVSPDMALVGGGDFVVTWGIWEHDLEDGNGIFGQLFSADGSRRGAEFQVNSATLESRYWTSSVASNAAGNFVVAFHGHDADGSFYHDIFARRFAADGIPLEPEFRVNTWTYEGQYFGQVAMDNDGDFVVVWDYDNQQYDIRAQLYSSAGLRQGREFRVNSAGGGSLGRESEAATAMTGEGEFVAVWNEGGRDGPGGESTWGDGSIVGRRYRSDGTPMEDDFLINSYTTDHQRYPAVAVSADGDFVVVWESYGSNGTDSSSWSIQAQRYTVSVAASFSWRPARPREDQEIEFFDTSTGREPRTWSWDFGDGSTSTLQAATHVYDRPGRYTVSLTVSDGFGRHSQSQAVRIRSLDPPAPPGPTTLYLGEGRFQVEVDWRDFDGDEGSGHVVPVSSDGHP